tara:strand:+ start:85 stop:273 length:189 start_codon:yes stop_codon:yes gene_type:complete
MIIWEAKGDTDRIMRRYFATKKKALAWAKYQELENATIEKIELNGRYDVAHQLNILANELNT